MKVHYEGRLIDGKVFDSSIARGEPATFPLNGVIACWTEGVQTMKVGGKAQLICPANLAYGANGSPPTIPPESTLVFDVGTARDREVVRPLQFFAENARRGSESSRAFFVCRCNPRTRAPMHVSGRQTVIH